MKGGKRTKRVETHLRKQTHPPHWGCSHCSVQMGPGPGLESSRLCPARGTTQAQSLELCACQYRLCRVFSVYRSNVGRLIAREESGKQARSRKENRKREEGGGIEMLSCESRGWVRGMSQATCVRELAVRGNRALNQGCGECRGTKDRENPIGQDTFVNHWRLQFSRDVASTGQHRTLRLHVVGI
jgi:hypothetical protein